METITIQVDSKAARAYRSSSAEERRKLEALLSIWLLEATKTHESLQETMRDISRKAQERGLTPEILRSILDEGQ